MNRTQTDALANIHFRLRYADDNASHTHLYYARRVNFWRDFFPEDVLATLLHKETGDSVALAFGPDQMVGPYKNRDRFRIKPSQFARRTSDGYAVVPHYGRFYPKGLLQQLPGIFSENTQPFRCLAVENHGIEVEFNHPLAGKPVQVSAVIDSVLDKIAEQGGSSIDWLTVIADGPGMQSRCNGAPTDFFSEDAFRRQDERADDLFYRQPRFVQHIDRRAIMNITQLYADLLTPGMRVLDLMSSWVSHLPPQFDLDSVVGLGLNRAELEANERLDQHVAHDLNREPSLPFAAAEFDAVICTASVEYLIHPFDVFKEVARVLRKGGLFVVTFSNRWFPPKAIKLWTELLEFERLGMVLEYFMKSGNFKGLETLAVRGYPRPVDDKYFPQMRYADQVYAVYGCKR